MFFFVLFLYAVLIIEFDRIVIRYSSPGSLKYKKIASFSIILLFVYLVICLFILLIAEFD